MKKRNLVLATVAGALVAVAVAVPAFAAYMGKAAEAGTVALYHYTPMATDTAPAPQYVATGVSKVRLAYDTKVDPYGLSWTLAGTCLRPRTEYSLVNVRRIFWDTSLGDFWLVDVLGSKTASARGILTMKGSTKELGSTLYPYSGGDSEGGGYYGEGAVYGFDTWWFRFPGAEVWLVPSDEIQTDDGSAIDWPEPFSFVSCYDQDGSAVDPEWWLASLGLPVDSTDVDTRTYSRNRPAGQPETAPQSQDGAGPAQRTTGN